ncbi:Rib/alpha-like domain-containing protein [Corynebacterium lizhenjunii]|uniref:Rib/alpha-like domain-containing protein n=1 Tax=Corynebacterium lizhenjunii TaxID=2709394 RepID=UPI0013EAC153|nr:Rib/alpha-like domain-containing protein [Corynebacterium lizhenjunii]
MAKKFAKPAAVGRRRGVTIAAAALSVSLVAPFVHPVLSPQTAAVASAQDAGLDLGAAATPATPGDTTTSGGKQAIYSPAQEGERHTISGTVWGERGNIPGALGDSLTYVRNVKQDVGVEGIKVFAQWYDGYGGPRPATSPVYYAITDAQGNYRIKMQDFRDIAGRNRIFSANSDLSPEWREKIRIWVEIPDHLKDKYNYAWGYANNLSPRSFAVDTSVGAGWGGERVTQADQFLFPKYNQEEKPVLHKPEDQWVNNDARHRTDRRGQLSGRIYWDYGGYTPPAYSWNNVVSYDANDDKAIGGQKVVASYLSDHALGQIRKYVEENKNTIFGGKKLRGIDWTAEYEAKLQEWIKEQIAANKDGDTPWIAESVVTTSDQDGQYTIQFNGTYGHKWDSAGKVPTTQGASGENYAGNVASTPGSGKFEQGTAEGLTSNQAKHINWEWMMVSLVQEDGTLGAVEGAGQVDPWRGGYWSGRTGTPFGNFYTNSEIGDVAWNAQSYLLDDKTSPGTQPGSSEWRNVNFAHTLNQNTFEVVEYDAISNFAKPGDKVDTRGGGYPALGGNKYAIVWTATDLKTGNDLKLDPAKSTCEGIEPNEKGLLPSCSITVPESLENSTLFTATLYPINENGKRGPAPIAADSFVAQVAKVPVYDPVNVTTGKSATSPVLGVDNTETPEVEKEPVPEGTTFELALAEGAQPIKDGQGNITGYKIGEDVRDFGYSVNVDPNTGDVTFIAPETMTDPVTNEETPFTGTFNVPVTMTLPGGEKGTANATFVVSEEAADYNPEYPGQNFTHTPQGGEEKTTDKPGYLAPAGKTSTADVVYKPKEGGEENKPGDGVASYKLKEGFQAPKGYEITVDEKTGKVSVTVAPAGKDGAREEIVEIPVVVSYNDGAEDDEATAVFYLDTDGDGIPDVLDDDDDNDGVKDEDENKTGHDPKDPSDTPTTVTGDPKTVEPTNDSQDTGIVVHNPDPSTGYTATDEDGKNVPVTVDKETGKISVTPGEDVDGPITLVIKDSDLPGGSVEFEIPVNGHAKDKDDNGSDKTDADKNDPKGQDQTVKVGQTPDPKKNIENFDDLNLPEGTKVEYKGGIPDTSKPGEQNVTVVVTYPDKSQDEVEAKLKVEKNPTEVNSDNVTPVKPNGEDQDTGIVVTNNDDKTKVTAKDKNGKDVPARIDEDGKVIVTPGKDTEGPITVTISDPDLPGGSVNVEVPVTSWADQIDPKGKDQTVSVGNQPDPKGNIENIGDLPEGTKIKYKDPVDTSTPGEKDVTVVVTYPDDSEDTVMAKVNVVADPTLADQNEPTGQNQDVKKNETPDPEKNISNVSDLPKDTKFEYVTTPDTSTPGTKDVTVVVTYPDGSTDTVKTTVTVTPDDSDKYDPKGKDQTVKVGETPDPKKNIENFDDLDLPEGTKVEYKDTPDTSKSGDQNVTVVVTYPDGSKDNVEAKLKVEKNPTEVDSGNVNPVKPNGEDQDTGIVITNKDDETTVTAKDKNGKDVPATIDEDGKVIVKPGKDTEGPITVTITDPDLPGGEVEVKVPVTSWADQIDPKGQDQTVKVGETPEAEKNVADFDNLPEGTTAEYQNQPDTSKPGEQNVTVVVTYPDGSKDNVEAKLKVEKNPTEVDSGNVNPVKPNGEDQDTGIVITNKDDETTVTAKDKNGKDVPARIDEDGKVIVKPGKDTEGPITVTITDPDLPGGEVEVKVPVKDRDDNGSEKNPTSVNSDNVKTVDPTDEKQDTGIVVTNKDDDTKISAKDEDGKDVPVEIGEDGKVHVTPGKDVDGPIVVTIEDPDLPGGKVEVEVPVTGHEKGKDDNNSDKKPGADGSSNAGGSSIINNGGSSNNSFNSSNTGAKVDLARCVPAGLAVGLPLLFLIPVGLAGQVNIPGLQPLQDSLGAQIARVNDQLAQANVQLQRQLGIFNADVASPLNGINAQLGKFGQDAGRVAGSVALVAAGVLALAWLIDSCTPGNSSSAGSSKTKN